MAVILASASPRRSQLLRGLGISFDVRPANCDEQCAERDPGRLVCELARRKALAVTADAQDTVIAADTVVCLDGDILGKPHDEGEARAMLRRLSGNRHTVFTGVAVRRADRLLVRAEQTDVYFRSLPDAYIERYVQSGEPLDKAGAYGIQGVGGAFVHRIEGDFYNVMGLPLCTLCKMLEEIGAQA
ncbi:MAG TPA: septum formation inhibitor Maf [Candidatus Ventrousia excrementavium]|uniref:dTTP/UTP pyrophosphatase n=1 Tax=Candidatus Ventrousia excrementavium TaxID=2840961 RepID=A0A9D1LLH2_9CLOT|nr:septum formation inhibitor Maf [Candidatus Ventrousia excrementavium]